MEAYHQEDAALDERSAVFRALGDPTRLRILEILPVEPVCEDMYNVNELVHEIGGSQPNMSRHLHILKHAGLVCCRKQCASVYYWRVPEAFDRIAAALASLGRPKRSSRKTASGKARR
jgi:DNA-binding transcriptional ArsR family regulator